MVGRLIGSFSVHVVVVVWIHRVGSFFKFCCKPQQQSDQITTQNLAICALLLFIPLVLIKYLEKRKSKREGPSRGSKFKSQVNHDRSTREAEI